jgi:hypothetical protein
MILFSRLTHSAWHNSHLSRAIYNLTGHRMEQSSFRAEGRGCRLELAGEGSWSRGVLSEGPGHDLRADTVSILEKADLRREVDRLRDDVRYAEQFLSKPNQVPETALTEKLGDINDKISEIAGIASKLHSHQALPIARSSSGPLFPAKVAQILGKELVTALETKPHNSSAKFVQMALQSILLDLVRDIFNAQWCDLAVVKTSEYIKTTGMHEALVLLKADEVL